jgi:hypothetical protein
MKRTALRTNVDDDVRTVDDFEFPHVGFSEAVFDAASPRDGIGLVFVALASLAVCGGRCEQQRYGENAKSHDAPPVPEVEIHSRQFFETCPRRFRRDRAGLLNLEERIADAHGDVGMIAEHPIHADLHGKEFQELFERPRIRRQVVASECISVQA